MVIYIWKYTHFLVIIMAEKRGQGQAGCNPAVAGRQAAAPHGAVPLPQRRGGEASAAGLLSILAGSLSGRGEFKLAARGVLDIAFDSFDTKEERVSFIDGLVVVLGKAMSREDAISSGLHLVNEFTRMELDLGRITQQDATQWKIACKTVELEQHYISESGSVGLPTRDKFYSAAKAIVECAPMERRG